MWNPVQEGCVDDDGCPSWIGAVGSSEARAASAAMAADSGTARRFDFAVTVCLPEDADGALSAAGAEPASTAKALPPAASAANTILPKINRRMIRFFLVWFSRKLVGNDRWSRRKYDHRSHAR
jgi:hypothetical protein